MAKYTSLVSGFSYISSLDVKEDLSLFSDICLYCVSQPVEIHGLTGKYLTGNENHLSDKSIWLKSSATSLLLI